MSKILQQLAGGDFRSIGKSNEVVRAVIRNPRLFSELFAGLLQDDPIIRMRTADAVEKITVQKPELLQKYKKQILNQIAEIKQQEVQWHVAQMIPRLQLSTTETQKAFAILNGYLRSTKSNIVRVMSLQALADLALQGKINTGKTLRSIEEYAELVGTPSVLARVRKITKLLKHTN